jgi:hypothetical protein
MSLIYNLDLTTLLTIAKTAKSLWFSVLCLRMFKRRVNMPFPELNDLSDPARAAQAVATRQGIIDLIPAFQRGDTFPKLNEAETTAIIEKIMRLANTEARVSFYASIITIGSKDPNATIILTPTMLKWAGKRKLPKIKVSQQKIGNAVNGRVLKKSGGL